MLARQEYLSRPSELNSRSTQLFDLFLGARSTHGAKPALWVDGCTFIYAELYERAARLRDAIRMARSRKASSDQWQCGLSVNRTPTACTAILSTLMVGSAYVSLNPRFPRDRLRDFPLLELWGFVLVDIPSLDEVFRRSVDIGRNDGPCHAS